MAEIFTENENGNVGGGIIDDNNIRVQKTYSSQKIEDKLNQKANKASNSNGKILVGDVDGNPVASSKSPSDFSPSNHNHNATTISVSNSNFTGVLPNSIDTVQKLADFIDDNIGLGRSLEFDINGTQLGIKQEGDTNFTYFDTQGEQGNGLEFNWNGTQLGVRVLNSGSSFSYVDLEGPAGNDGEDGNDGLNLEFTWSGTQLGVRREGESNYSFRELKGETGNGIASVVKTSGTGAPGTTDTYTITFTDTTTTTFQVVNGANGEGAVQSVNVSGGILTIDATDPANPIVGLSGVSEANITDLDKYTQLEVTNKIATAKAEAITQAKNELINGASASYDTLLELQSELESNDTDISSILSTQSTKMDKVLGSTGSLVRLLASGNAEATTLVAGDIPELTISKITNLQTTLNNKLEAVDILGKANLSGGNIFSGDQIIDAGLFLDNSAYINPETATLNRTMFNMWTESSGQFKRNLDISIRGAQGGGVGGSQIVFWTNSASSNIPIERMVLTRDGNVGIGTISPAYKLHVAQTSGGVVGKLESGGEYTALKLLNTSGGHSDWELRANDNMNSLSPYNAFSINVGSYFDPAMMIQPDKRVRFFGNVGFGINSPVSPIHTLENSTEVGSGAGITIEQDGTGDAVLQILRTGVIRWKIGSPSSSSFVIGNGSLTNPALEIATNATVIVNKLKVVKTFQLSGADYNTAIEGGFYSAQNGANKPSGFSSWCYLEVIVHSASYIYQRATELTDSSNPKSAYRNYVAGTWSAWQEFNTTAI